ncbi:hypothetical protein ANTQUA_LOCUS6738 [Anthophora quadrimaculata]
MYNSISLSSFAISFSFTEINFDRVVLTEQLTTNSIRKNIVEFTVLKRTRRYSVITLIEHPRHQRCYVVKYCTVNYANLDSSGKRTRLVSR